MTDWSTCPAVEHNTKKISGAWAFTGTRVPVYALFENLESGATVNQYLEWFPRGEGVAGRGCPQARGGTPQSLLCSREDSV